MSKFVYALVTTMLISSVVVAADQSSTTGSTEGQPQTSQQETDATSHKEDK